MWRQERICPAGLCWHTFCVAPRFVRLAELFYQMSTDIWTNCQTKKVTIANRMCSFPGQRLNVGHVFGYQNGNDLLLFEDWSCIVLTIFLWFCLVRMILI